MKIGRIQEKIICYLRELPDCEGHLGITTRAPDIFGGEYWEDVEKSIERLKARGIVKQVEGRMPGIIRLV